MLLKPIDQDTLQKMGHDKSEDSGLESGGDDGSSSSRINEPNDSFEDDIVILRDFCLLSTDEDGNTLEMHALVQLSTRRWLEADGLRESFKRQFVKRLAMEFPMGTYDNWAVCRPLFVHVEAAVDHQPVQERARELWRRLMFRGGRFAWLQGRYETAEKMAENSQKSRMIQLGEDGQSTLQRVHLY